MKRRIYFALRRTGLPADQAFKLATSHMARLRAAIDWRDFDTRR